MQSGRVIFNTSCQCALSSYSNYSKRPLNLVGLLPALANTLKSKATYLINFDTPSSATDMLTVSISVLGQSRPDGWRSGRLDDESHIFESCWDVEQSG